MRLLDAGAVFYAPGIVRSDAMLLRKVGPAYALQVNDEQHLTLRSFPPTHDGVVALAFFLAFAGVEYT